MRSIYTKLALYGSTNYCARIDTFFLPNSEVCDDSVSLALLVYIGLSTPVSRMLKD